MSHIHPPTSAAAFESIYRSAIDPWHFATSPYEQFRHATTMESLQRTTYRTGFEPGCSIGELTVGLARVCRRVIATDIAPTAVSRARERCKQMENVAVRLAAGATEVPDERLDLIVFSEIGYYFNSLVLTDYAANLADRLQAGGEFIAVHWLGDSADHVMHGDVVHDILLATLPLSWVQGNRYDGFRIDSWICT